MNNREKTLKKLAAAIIKDKKLDPKIRTYILEDLTKEEQRKLLHYLKVEKNRKTVTVYSANTLDIRDQQSITDKFKNMSVEFEVDETIGAGLIIKDNDTIINMSVKGYIDRTVKALIK